MTELHFLDAVFVPRDLPPRRSGLRLADVVGELAAIAIRHRRQQPPAIMRSGQMNLRDARKIAAGGVGIFALRCPELVKINLLEEVQVGLGSLALVGIASIENPCAVGRPRCAAAAGGVLHTDDAVGQTLAGFSAVKMQRALLAAVFGKADGDQFPIGRRHEPIHRDLTLRLNLVRVEHDFLRRQIICRSEGDEQSLLLRRLELQREQPPWTRHESAVGRRVFPVEGRELRLDARAVTPRIQPSARVFVLRRSPRLHRRRTGFLQPAVIVHDFHAVILIGDGFLVGGRNGGVDGHGDGE